MQVLGGGGGASLQQGDQLTVEGRASSQALPHPKQEPATALELLLLPLLWRQEESQPWLDTEAARSRERFHSAPVLTNEEVQTGRKAPRDMERWFPSLLYFVSVASDACQLYRKSVKNLAFKNKIALNKNSSRIRSKVAENYCNVWVIDLTQHVRFAVCVNSFCSINRVRLTDVRGIVLLWKIKYLRK